VSTAEFLASLRNALIEALGTDVFVSIEFPPLAVHASWLPEGAVQRRHAVCRVDAGFFDGKDANHQMFIGDCVNAALRGPQLNG
jgi:hypothetical protein